MNNYYSKSLDNQGIINISEGSQRHVCGISGFDIHVISTYFLSWFWRRISVDLHPEWGGGSVIGTVTRYMQDSSGCEPQWGKKFCLPHTHADQSWGQ